MNQKLSRAVAMIVLTASVNVGSAASDLTARWVARVLNGDGTVRETVSVLNQQGSTLTGSVIGPTSEQPIVEGTLTATRSCLRPRPPRIRGGPSIAA